MKKIVFSIVSMLTSLTAVVEANDRKTPGDFMENIINLEVPLSGYQKIFFVNVENLKEVLEGRQENQGLCVVFHPKSSPLNKIILNTLKHPKWNHLELKEKVYSIQEFKKIVESQNLPLKRPRLKREIIGINIEKLEAYIDEWMDCYLDIKDEQRALFVEDVILAAKALSKGQAENNVYLLIEYIFFLL